MKRIHFFIVFSVVFLIISNGYAKNLQQKILINGKAPGIGILYHYILCNPPHIITTYDCPLAYKFLFESHNESIHKCVSIQRKESNYVNNCPFSYNPDSTLSNIYGNRIIFKYNGNNNLTSILDGTMYRRHTIRLEYHYNENEIDSSYMYHYYGHTLGYISWTKSIGNKYVFDQNVNKLTSEVVNYRYSCRGNKSFCIGTKFFTYDENGLNVSDIFKGISYNVPFGDSIAQDSTSIEYSVKYMYDLNKNIIEKIYGGSSYFNKTSRITYNYNSQGLVEDEIHYVPDSIGWRPETKYSFTYISADAIAEIKIFRPKNINDSFSLSSTLLFIYDNSVAIGQKDKTISRGISNCITAGFISKNRIAFHFDEPFSDYLQITIFDIRGKILKKAVVTGGKYKKKCFVLLPNNMNTSKLLLYRVVTGNRVTTGNIFSCQ